ncbi:MAG: bifunctional 5,10-methylenetetrahydrofolate dehydrogenase/5,10-methenyltetrahydrofolate cyclohydrolase [Clostridia bacterium]|nr:bifunctional 5,10-methylenetetrahydrofolate dehydrogenase/5,10-methenyltetrahydrofolate cyclohydrolase [Clostridia bacterium]
MSAQIINGRALAAQVYAELDARVGALRACGVTPRVALILVGGNELSKRYVSIKENAATSHGMECIVYHLSDATTQERLIELIGALNRDRLVHGVLVQMPLPEHMDTAEVLDAIEPTKDIDGLHFCNTGKLLNSVPAVVACTPRAIMRILDDVGVRLERAHTVIVGRSMLVGKPIAICLLNRNATVSVCHSHTPNLGDITRTADVLVVAAGSPRLIKADMVKDDAVVIDVGQSTVDGKLCGDVDFPEVSKKASYITKVTGGVGPMTVAMLMTNLVDCAELAMHTTAKEI